ncbi:hypothetical protein BCLUESOX_1223 [bacterium endosymbiont of Bathymodiolus sp. 5 South]|nr:hypothetical protein [uncultured Gammaproteobacteria bacterium]SHN93918.1 hypothetical protein BCLUESOX_1223 [bacterium endosymbiont of Bathymodiolus sp. 5 South]
MSGVDIISTIPSNANDGAVANDDAGKIGATLAIISQMAATNGNSATEVIGVLKAAIKNQTLSGEFSSAISAFQREVSIAAGKTSIKDNVNNVFDTLVGRAIRKISLYNGEDNDPVPTVRDYLDIKIGTVKDNNLSLKNLRIAAEKDRTKKDSVEEIRAIVSSQSKASFKINLIAVASVFENIVFTSPTPTLTGDSRVGDITWAIGGEDANKFTINAKNGVVSMIARDYEKPVDKDKDNVYKVTIIATDGDKNTTSKDLGVTVKNVFEFVSKTITFDGLDYITLESPITGKIWLDRNLGATQAATSRTDSASYGDLYQWGRKASGHQKRNSSTTSTRASSIGDNGNLFIKSDSGSTDWVKLNVDENGAERTKHWGMSQNNNICPLAFEVPTKEQLSKETVNIKNTSGAFSSFLKIPSAGFRSRSGNLSHVSTSVGLWTRSAVADSGFPSEFWAHYFFADSSQAKFDTIDRSYAHSVRCISAF